MNVAGALVLCELIAASSQDLAGAVSAWYAELRDAKWECSDDLCAQYPKVQVNGPDALFDLGHDDHCAIVRVNYEVRSVLVKYVGPRAGAPWAKRRVRSGAKP